MNIVKLRFKDNNGDYYPNWEESKIINYFEIIKGKMPKNATDKKWFQKQTNNFLLKTSNINNLGKIYNNPIEVSEIALPFLYKAKKNTLIITEGGEPGKIAFLKNDYFIDYHIYHLKNKFEIKNNENVNLFIFYFILKNRNKFEKLITGTTLKSLKKGELENFKILIPLSSEQEKIANLLTDIDKYNELIREELKLQEEYKNTLLNKIMNQELRFKDNNGDYYPNWEESKIINYFEIIKGKMPKNATDKKWFQKQTNNFLLKTSNINNLGKIYNNPIEVSEIALPFLYKAKKNTLIITEGGEPGKIAFLKNDYFIDYHIYHLKNKFEIKNNENVNLFIFYFILKNRNKFEKLITGTTLKSLKKGELENFKILIPLSSEQEKIANLLTDIDKYNELIREELKLQEEYKNTLLTLLF